MEKCQFCRPEMKYLGYVVDRNGLHVDPGKVEAMLQLPIPANVSEVRRVVGTFSWYRRFVPDFSSIISPITALLRKNSKFQWTDECSQSFRRIKECLVAAPILSCPDYTLPFVVQTDASGYGLGAVLTQPHPDGDRVISYLSRSLTRQERNFSTTERECLGILFALEKLRPYLEGVPFTVITDHYSLLWLQSLKDLTGRLARWAVRLQQYDFKVIHRKGKEHIVPDTLSRSVPVVDLVDVDSEESASRAVEGDRWYRLMAEKVRKHPLKYSKWRVGGNRLWKYVNPAYPNLSEAVDSWKLVVPKQDRHGIIVAAHEPPTSGHTGVFKTFARVSETHYWPKMRSDVAKFVRHCKVCSSHKSSQERPTDKMVSHPKANRPWEMISTDLIGPFPRSKHGNMYVLVVADYLSKFSLLFPLRRATADAVARKLENEVFLVFGVPKLIMCDNGPQYRSKELGRLASKYQVHIKYNANYHPRANPAERVNRTLKTMLAMYVSDNHRCWDENLAQVACALRTSKHEVTKLTPYFINFGRTMFLSGEDYRQKELLEVEDGTQAGVMTRNESFRQMFGDIRSRLEVAAQKTCATYNLRRRHIEYLPHQLVWKRNFVLSDAARYFSKKLAPKFVGPFQIKKKLSPWTYELEDAKGNPKGVWHTKDLKPCLEENDQNNA